MKCKYDRTKGIGTREDNVNEKKFITSNRPQKSQNLGRARECSVRKRNKSATWILLGYVEG